ncbi:MAG: AAA family ATPase [Fimbriimonadaceae bacterium]|nr:AAA family ATPase [Fimbriimonadaceae bacterium]
MIQRLYAHNYRCFQNFELNLSDHRSTLLIGRNGSGKSTCLKVLDLLRSIAAGENRIPRLVAPEDFAFGSRDQPMRFGIEALIATQRFGYTIAFELPPSFRALRVLDEQLTCDGEVVYSRERSEVSLATGGPRTSGFQMDWHAVALPIIQGRSADDPVAVFRRWLAGLLLLEPIPRLMSGESDDECDQLAVDGSNYAAWLRRVLGEQPAVYAPLLTTLRAVLPDLLDFQQNQSGGDARSLTARFRQGDAVAELNFGRLSAGEKCFFLGATVLAANQVAGPRCCFWDEPDSHLALDEVAHFVLDQRANFEARGQVLMTSHSPEVVRMFPLDRIYLLHRDSHLEPTVVRPADQMSFSGELHEALRNGELEP